MLARMVVRSKQRGDTIIEVMLASAIFSLVAVGALVIMNQGTASAQRTLELGLVRQEMNSQAETLRYMHAASVASRAATGTNTADWNNVLAKRVAGPATKFGTLNSDGHCIDPGVGNNFVVNTRTAKVASVGLLNKAQTFSQLRYGATASTAKNLVSAQGIWIEAIQGTRFTDFHIRACWDASGVSVPTTLGTIVRLYEP